MPYKNTADRMKRQQERRDTPTVDTPTVDTPDVTLLSRPNGKDYDPGEKLFGNPHYTDGTFRYLGPLSDGQVLDRLTV